MVDHIKPQDLLRRMYRAADQTGLPAGDVMAGARLLRLAAFQLGRIAESECNGIERWDSKARMVLASWTEADQARADRLTARHEQRARDALAVAYGASWGDVLEIKFQGDPRGAPFTVCEKVAEGPARELFAVW